MSYDPNKVLMGATGSSHKEVTNHTGDPATFEAGVVCRLKSDDTLSLAKADGSLWGVSLGASLSNTLRVAVCRKGLRVPIKLTTGFDPVVGAAVAVSDTTGLAKAYTGTGDSYVNAVYVTGRVGGTGVNGGIGEDGAMKGVALIDFPGGL